MCVLVGQRGGEKVVAGLGGVQDYVFVRERVWRGLLFSREGHWSGVWIKVIRSIWLAEQQNHHDQASAVDESVLRDCVPK